MLRFIRTLLCLGLLLLFGLLPAQLGAQERKSDSPVFRSYRPPPVAPRVQESEALRQIWHAFLAARKAQAGDRHAQEEMGIRYLLGQGVERDTAKAAYWMLKAAEQGMVRAKFNVAIMAFHGWGMPWDPFLSYRYLQESAREGMPEAEYFIAVVLTENLVVPRDWKQAYAWMKKAADAVYKPAKEVLAEFAEKSAEAEQQADGVSEFAAASSPSLPPSVMPVMLDFAADSARSRDRSLGDILRGAGGNLRVALGLAGNPDSALNVDSVAFRQLVRAADAGSPEALTMLGRCAERGLEMKKDSIAAAAYFVRATRLDGPKAPQLLAQLLQQGSLQAQLRARSSRSDPLADFVWAGVAALGFDNLIAPNQALRLLRRSVDRGLVPALVEMGIWYYSGKWVVQDVMEADSLWHRAARAGSRDAEVRLAVTALRDAGSEAPDSAAVALLRKAIPEGSLLAQVGLGYCHEHGIGVRKDAGEAAVMYRAAAVRGSQDAFRALRRLYDAMRPPEKEFVIEEE